MAIIVNLDVMLARRKMKVGELADKVGITLANISILKNGKAKAVRMETLDKICAALGCQPGDILEYQPDSPGGTLTRVREPGRTTGTIRTVKTVRMKGETKNGQ